MVDYYFYTEEEYCFYIHNIKYGFRIPIQKCQGFYTIGSKAMDSVITKLNDNDDAVVRFYEELVERGLI